VIQIRRHALVRYSPEAMFDLVDDVEAYPTRFPWCADAKIVAREAEIDLDAVLLPVERQRNQRVALALDRADELVDLGTIDAPKR